MPSAASPAGTWDVDGDVVVDAGDRACGNGVLQSGAGCRVGLEALGCLRQEVAAQRRLVQRDLAALQFDDYSLIRMELRSQKQSLRDLATLLCEGLRSAFFARALQVPSLLPRTFHRVDVVMQVTMVLEVQWVTQRAAQHY